MLVEMNPSGGGSGTEITPSNSSPVALTNGETYTTNGNGYAIQSYTSKTPSSSPSSVSSGDIVKMGGSGYLINSYSSVTPSSSGTYFSAGMKNMTSSGYAYSSNPSGGTPKMLAIASGTGAGVQVSVSNNAKSTLYAVTTTASTNATYRANNTTIASTSGCSYELLDTKENNNGIMRLYKLTNCQSSLSVTMNSTTSSTNKLVTIFSIQ